ncbi:mucin-binding protein [Lacticaseibacillus saniviri]|uniref:mucin-binding protein n=1 Tax=Lacticaseibacillus saniviri TaxID=931533 RepID=UPI001EDD19B4|nr:LPXTG cell wall anchor domain-containing protein [Lacticaseibacillus saniviri]MCG4281387.1 LPXTG cell wall anchor domain-containing protein [Lacticaseibacillus saniviri]
MREKMNYKRLFVAGTVLLATAGPLMATQVPVRAAETTQKKTVPNVLPTGAIMPAGYDLTVNPDGSWKLTPPQASESVTIPTLDSAYLSNQETINNNPQALLTYLNNFGMTVFSGSTLQGQGAYDGSLATGSDLQLAPGGGLHLKSIHNQNYSALLNGDIILSPIEGTPISSDSPIYFTENHGFVGKGTITWELINHINGGTFKAFTLPTSAQNWTSYFRSIHTALNGLSHYFSQKSTAAAQAKVTAQANGNFILPLSQAMYDEPTHTYYFAVSSTADLEDHTIEFTGQAEVPDAKVVVNFINDNDKNTDNTDIDTNLAKGQSLNSTTNVNSSNIILNLPDNTTVNMSDTSNSYNGVRILAPSAVIVKHDAIFSGSANIYGGKSENPFHDQMEKKITVHFIDDTDKQPLPPDLVMTAHEGLLDDLKNTVSSTIKDFESKGYRLVTDETSKLDENSQLDGLYNVHLEHATEVRPSAAVKVITQTINYISSIDRKVLHDPYRNQIEFRRADTIDLVNKEVINHTWSKESDNFAAVDVPQITGFTRKIDNIPSVSVTPDSQNIVKNVAFTPKNDENGATTNPVEPGDNGDNTTSGETHQPDDDTSTPTKPGIVQDPVAPFNPEHPNQPTHNGKPTKPVTNQTNHDATKPSTDTGSNHIAAHQTGQNKPATSTTGTQSIPKNDASNTHSTATQQQAQSSTKASADKSNTARLPQAGDATHSGLVAAGIALITLIAAGWYSLRKLSR